ncbi:MAG: hypothetical protein WC810_22810 [Janthinobacterium sp.]
MEKTKQHIGKAGELLVQYKLIKYGIDSSAMTTDSGIDLVAYSPRNMKAYTIQVKTTEKPTPAGGKGKLATGWTLREDSPADLIALTDLSTDSAWLFTHHEFADLAQEHSSKGIFRLYMYTDETIKTQKSIVLKSHFAKYLMDERIKTFF